MGIESSYKLKKKINKGQNIDATAPEFDVLIENTHVFNETLTYDETTYEVGNDESKFILTDFNAFYKHAWEFNPQCRHLTFVDNNGYGLKVVRKDGSIVTFKLEVDQVIYPKDNDIFVYDKDNNGSINKEIIIGVKEEYLDSIREIIVPNGVKDLSLPKCSVKRLVIPASVESIDYRSLRVLPYLEEIVIDENNPVYGSYDCNVIVDKARMSVVSGCLGSSIPHGVVKIDMEAFKGVLGLEKIVLSDSVEVIEPDAFAYCSNLQEIVFSSSLKRIGQCAFRYCGSLREVNFPDSLEFIDDEAFENCYSLTNVVIPDSCQKIGRDAFIRCFNLRSFVLPNKEIIKLPSRQLGFDFEEPDPHSIILPRRILGVGRGMVEPGPFGNPENTREYSFHGTLVYGTALYYGTKDNPYLIFTHIDLINSLDELYIEPDCEMIANSGNDGDHAPSTVLRTIHMPKSVRFIGTALFNGRVPFNEVTIEYEGTLEEWERITRDDLHSEQIRVKCVDGETMYHHS